MGGGRASTPGDGGSLGGELGSCLWCQISSRWGRKELMGKGQTSPSGVSVAEGGDSPGELVVRGLTWLPCREGRRGSIQVDGEELVSGQSPGPNVAVNTKGSIYIGESWAPGAPSSGQGGDGAAAELGHPAFLASRAPGADRPVLSPPHRRSPRRGHADWGQVLLGHHGLYQEPGAALGPARRPAPTAPGPAAPRPGRGQHAPLPLIGSRLPHTDSRAAPQPHNVEYIIINIIIMTIL